MNALPLMQLTIKKTSFHKNEKPFNVNEVDIEEIFSSYKKSYGKNSFK